MYRPPDIETMEDFGQYYRSSFIGWRNPQDTGLPYVPVYVGPNDPTVVIINFEGKVQKNLSFKDVLDNAQFGAPQYGSTEVKNTAVYVSRRSQRTAHRGHRSGQGLNAHVFHPEKLVMLKSDLLTDWEYLRPLFNPAYRSLEETYGLLNSGERLACSLSRHFTGTLSEGYKVPVLHYKSSLVGYITGPNQIELEKLDDFKTLVEESFSGVEVK